MDTQTAPAHTYDAFNGGEEEQHGKKSPVLKKVKEKVKKIKNSITRKGNNHDDHQQHGDLDEGDDGYEEDEEEVVDPEVHGAPIYESSDPRVREATTENLPHALGGSHQRSDARAGLETNAAGGVIDASDARARLRATHDWPNTEGGIDGGSDARARLRVTHDWPNTEGGIDGGSDARARVGATHDWPNAEGGLDGGSDARARVGTTQESPNIFGGHEGSGAVGLGLITTELKEDPAVNNTKENYRAGEEVEVSPELCRSFDAMAVSNQDEAHPNDKAGDHLPKDQTSSYTEKLTSAKDAAVSAASMVYGKVAGAGTAVMAKVKPEASRDATVEHENIGKPQDKDDAMDVSNQDEAHPNNRAEDRLPKDQTSSYTQKLTSAKDTAVSAASMVYGKVADAGTAVMAKVRPDATRDATVEHENIGSPQDKGVSMRDYIAEKLTPGEDDKALSAAITEAVQRKKEAAPVTPPPQEVTGSGEAGGGLGVVGKIKETVSSFLGSGGSSPKSAPATESPTKVAEDAKNIHSRPADVVSHEKVLE